MSVRLEARRRTYVDMQVGQKIAAIEVQQLPLNRELLRSERLCTFGGLCGLEVGAGDRYRSRHPTPPKRIRISLS